MADQHHNSLGRERKLSAQKSRVKILNQTREHPEHRIVQKMSGLENKTIRGYFHNGRFVWG